MKENRKERKPTRLDMIREYQASRDRKQRRERKLKTEGIQKRGGNKKER